MFGFGLRLGNLRRSSNVSSFVGILDSYSSGLAGAWSIAYKLVTDYSGPLVRIRRASDNAELDINALSNGLLDVASLNAFVGGSTWFLRTVYNQQGTSGRNIGNSIASNQPQGAIGADGLPYLFGANSGFSSTGLASSLLSISVTETTQWSVGSSAAFVFDMITMRFGSVTERRLSNYSNALISQLATAGTTAQIFGTNTGRYTAILQSKTSGTRVSNGITSGSGTKFADSQTINYMMVGQGGGGNTWSQNSAWLSAAIWTRDLGDSDANSLNSAAKSLFNTQ